MTSALTKEWLMKIWDNYVVPEKSTKLLIMDQFSGHRSAEVLKTLDELGLRVVYVPAGCTSLVQPLDTDINKPWKDRIRIKFARWMKDVGIKKENETKKAALLKAPDYETVINWILQSMNEIPQAMVADAFKHCGEDFLIEVLYYCCRLIECFGWK
jgi:hypothetical protein